MNFKQSARLENVLPESQLLSRILESWDDLALPNCWLVAGAVTQTYWNHIHRYPAAYGIKDVDIIYFDPSDVSEAAENDHENRIARLYGDLDVTFDVKNQARVHLWYEQKFGYPISPYATAEAAIATFPTTAGAIGVRRAERALEFHAPFGTADLFELIVRPNKVQITRGIYEEKAGRWRSLWPRLKVLDWDDP